MQQMYSGQKLPNEEISILNLAASIQVSRFDNRRVAGYARQLGCQPGRNTMTLNYRSVTPGPGGSTDLSPGKTTSPVVLSFETKPGHEYDVDGLVCIVSGGNVYSPFYYYTNTNLWTAGKDCRREFVPYIFDRTDCKFIWDSDPKRARGAAVVIVQVYKQNAIARQGAGKTVVPDSRLMSASKELSLDIFSPGNLGEYLRMAGEKRSGTGEPVSKKEFQREGR